MVVKARIADYCSFHDDFVFDVCNLDSFLVMCWLNGKVSEHFRET